MKHIISKVGKSFLTLLLVVATIASSTYLTRSLKADENAQALTSINGPIWIIETR